MVESGQPVPGVEVHVHVHRPQYFIMGEQAKLASRSLMMHTARGVMIGCLHGLLYTALLLKKSFLTAYKVQV